MKRGHGKSTLLLAAPLALVGGLALVPTAATQPQAAQRGGVKGKFSLIMMVHTSSGGFGNLPGVNPWSGNRRSRARHAYRSIPCTGNAPVNNISSDLPSYNNRVRGSRVPSSMRAHPFAFRLRRARAGRRRMVGSINFTVCKLGGGPNANPDHVPDERKPRIRVRFHATPRRINAETLHFDGTFRLRGGTQRYRGLRGSGTIAGYLFCFNPAGCAATGGRYLDGQFAMQGNYADRTPRL